jgi:hypothetical protein
MTDRKGDVIMKDLIVILILALIIGAAMFYIIKTKKSGRKCIGCPSGGCKNCPSSANCTEQKNKL